MAGGKTSSLTKRVNCRSDSGRRMRIGKARNILRVIAHQRKKYMLATTKIDLAVSSFRGYFPASAYG